MELPTVTRAVREHRPFVVAAAAVLPLVTCMILAAWRETINVATAVLVLALIIVAAAATGDRLAGVVAALSSGAWFDFFLTEPYNQFTIYDPDDIEAAVLLILIGLAVTEVALWGRREQARASRRAGYLDGVLSTAEAVLTRDESADVRIDRVARQIAHVLGVPQCRFVAGSFHDPRPAILHHDGVVTRAGRPLNVERDGLPTDEETVLLVGHDDDGHGLFILTASDQVVRPTLEQRKVAVLLADQVAPLLGELFD